MAGEVTRRHRELAYEADRGFTPAPAGSKAENWVETGEGHYLHWNRFAQALADIEAAALAALPDSGELAHLEEGARLLRGPMFGTEEQANQFKRELNAWLEAERARTRKPKR
jgi:hypothetical protein